MNCTRCEHHIDLCPGELPYQDDSGDPLCSDCYYDAYMELCERCMNWSELENMDSRPGELIAIWREVPGRPENLEPGYYEVLEWPFMWDAMLTCTFDATHLKKIADLDEEGRLCADDEDIAPSCPLCPDCQRGVRKENASREHHEHK